MANKTYKCQTKCFYRNRVWVVGESLVLPEGQVPPKHFVDAAVYKRTKEEARLAADPRTLSELNKAEQKEALRALGHGSPAADAPKNAEEAQAESAVQSNQADDPSFA